MAIRSRTPILDEIYYNDAAAAYCASLPLEHFMESSTSAVQREITLESFALVRHARPDVHCFNEMLIQYPQADIYDIGRAVPDNMVVVHPEPIPARRSYNMPFVPAAPLLVLEYVSEGSQRKDYIDNLRRYEQDLQIPYYLMFDPERRLLNLFHRNPQTGRYSSVPPTAADRMAIPELELEVGLRDGWVRYWFRGELVPLPGDLADRLDATLARLKMAEEQVRIEREAREASEAEVDRLKAELKRMQGGTAV